MIAAVQVEGASAPCVIYWTGRVRLSVKVTSWCGESYDASDGVIQIPDEAKVCAECKAALARGVPDKATPR